MIAYTLAGDSNLDGTVNALDFAAISAHYGQTGADWIEGDFNYDGLVDVADFNLLAANFNQAAPSASHPLLGALVPEPAAMLIACAICLLPDRQRRRSRS